GLRSRRSHRAKDTDRCDEHSEAGRAESHFTAPFVSCDSDRVGRKREGHDDQPRLTSSGLLSSLHLQGQRAAAPVTVSLNRTTPVPQRNSRGDCFFGDQSTDCTTPIRPTCYAESWNGLMTASSWACGGMAKPQPSSSS